MTEAMNEATSYSVIPNPHPSVIQGLAETWIMHGEEWFDSKLLGLKLHKNRPAIVKLCNEWLEENGPPGPIRQIK